MASTHSFPERPFPQHTYPTDDMPAMPGQELRWPASAIWRRGEPQVRTIGMSDIRYAMARGFDDFWAAPSHALFLVLLYPVVGLMLSRLLFGYDILPMIFPLSAGFALVGPVAAIGLYEMSKRREQGKDVSVWHVFNVLQSPSIGAIVRLGLVMFALLVAWLWAAQTIYNQTMGPGEPESISRFVHDVRNSAAGRTMMFAGNLVGFCFALAAMVISVMSFPMLVDRNVSVATAVRTSVRAVLHNPGTFAVWGMIVAALLVLGMIPLFFGLAVVLPVLGHATWHLYRRTVSRVGSYRDDKR